MKTFVALLAVLCVCDARPGTIYELSGTTAYEGIDSFIIGGVNANQGEFPWQLSQQRLSGNTWGHSCGASLLSARYGLSAAHCVDGAAATILRVIAGLHDRTNTAGTTTSNIASYKMHEQYNNGDSTYANDISILTFATNIATVAGRIAYASLPANNLNNYAGSTCIISGWGRNSATNNLPNILQKASITILGPIDCLQASGGSTWQNHICISDPAGNAGACNGDSGGPSNCPSGNSHVVTGIASFVFALANQCLTGRPSVYTRTSAYLGWINTNTP